MLTYDSHIQTEVFSPHLPVFFLHAFPVNRKMWQPQMTFLREKRMDFVAFDYPGFGDSPLPENDLSIEDYGEYAYRLLKELGMDQAIFVGLSMGGYIALALYRRHPEIFRGLLLANTKAAADTEEGRQGRYKMIDYLKRTHDLSPLFRFHLSKFFSRETKEKNRQLIGQVKSLMEEASQEGIIRAHRAMAERADSTDLLSEMNFPVWVIAGEEDEISTVEEAQGIAEKLPQGKLHIIPNAAHLSNLEQPEAFNKIMWEYVEKVKEGV